MKQKEAQLKSIKQWMTASVLENAETLEKDASLEMVKSAGGNLIINDQETVQVQIIVTRNSNDFLGDFDKEVYS